MGPWLKRRDSSMPYQTWNAFPPEAVVQVRNTWGDSNIGPARSFYWGWEQNNLDGNITEARRLDTVKEDIENCWWTLYPTRETSA